MVKKVCVVAAMAIMGVALWMGAGCEKTEGTNGLEITPSTWTLGGSNANASVELTALVSSPLALPLVWSVSNPALGTIVSQSGSNALYSSNANSVGTNVVAVMNNTVTVRDQFNNEGSAVITHDIYGN